MRFLLLCFTASLLLACASPHQPFVAGKDTDSGPSRPDLAEYDALGLTKLSSFPVFRSDRVRGLNDHAFIVKAGVNRSFLLVVDTVPAVAWQVDRSFVRFLPDVGLVEPGKSDVLFYGRVTRGKRPLLAAYEIEWRGAEEDLIARLRRNISTDIRAQPPIAD